MIHHGYRCIFIHQRKTGGVSIISAFGLSSEDKEWHHYNDGVLGDYIWDRRPNYFVFSTVRNPFDRLVSGWLYLGETRSRPLIDVISDKKPTDLVHRHILRPQIAILRHPDTGALVTDELIRYETLQTDFDRICGLIGKPRTQLPTKNVGKRRRRDYRTYFDDETRALAEELFRDDLDAFGYEF